MILGKPTSTTIFNVSPIMTIITRFCLSRCLDLIWVRAVQMACSLDATGRLRRPVPNLTRCTGSWRPSSTRPKKSPALIVTKTNLVTVKKNGEEEQAEWWQTEERQANLCKTETRMCLPVTFQAMWLQIVSRSNHWTSQLRSGRRHQVGQRSRFRLRLKRELERSNQNAQGRWKMNECSYPQRQQHPPTLTALSEAEHQAYVRSIIPKFLLIPVHHTIMLNCRLQGQFNLTQDGPKQFQRLPNLPQWLSGGTPAAIIATLHWQRIQGADCSHSVTVLAWLLYRSYYLHRVRSVSH